MTYRDLICEEIKFKGHNGDEGNAYYARPKGDGPFPGIVFIHHLPGRNESCIEATRRLAHHGYSVICNNLYFREGEGDPDDIGARMRAAGGIADEQMLGDVSGAMAFLRAQKNSNGKVGVIGWCSGGRHTYLAACRLPGVDAAVDDDLELGKILLQAVGIVILQRRYLAVFLRRQAFQDCIARMDDEDAAAGLAHLADAGGGAAGRSRFSGRRFCSVTSRRRAWQTPAHPCTRCDAHRR